MIFSLTSTLINHDLILERPGVCSKTKTVTHTYSYARMYLDEASLIT